ncbi:MAG TPA: class I SAM-dependent methyltransferase [Polyangiaceae bacterium]|nr:class I SAM-dependent methyltransferase [Polyangiaceae bacterium]
MRLSDAEFRAMNGGLRRFLHRRVEFPALVRLGLAEGAGRDVLELGCGNGFGAELIARLRPRSYTGIDVMPEQIALAERRRLAGARFRVGDASAVDLPDASADLVVIFGILHHVERWREALGECARLLRAGGVLVVEEPDGALLRQWDRLFRWDHPGAGFSLEGLERELPSRGLRLERRVKLPGVFGAYRARKPASGDADPDTANVAS